MLDFTGQVVLITGAGSPKGIGRTIAHTFGRQGAQVVLCDINQAGLDANVREMEELGYKAYGIAGNLCRRNLWMRWWLKCLRSSDASMCW